MAYEPMRPPEETDPELARYLMDELRRIAENFQAVSELQLDELNVEPVRPRDGMIKLADGTNWNPGSGAGFYGRRGGAWQLLG
jgi:hypothetical protein